MSRTRTLRAHSSSGKGRLLARQDGSSLLVVLMMLLALGAMAAVAVVVSSTDLVVSGNHRQSLEALSVAEAGVSEAVRRLNMKAGETVTVGGTPFAAAIADPSDPPQTGWRTRIYLTAPDSPPAASAGEQSTGTIQTPGSYLDYSDPTDPNEAVIVEHKTRDFDGDGSAEVVLYDPLQVPPENPNTGEPVERITVTGRSGPSRRSLQVDVIRIPLTPNVTAGLQAGAAVDLTGQVTVCGHNHRLDTPFNTQLPACSPGWDEPDGHLPAVMTSGDAVTTLGSTDLLGVPAPIDTDPANPFYTLAEALGISDHELQEILDDADHISIADPNPLDGVTFIDGDCTIMNKDGTGLLYITGDVYISGMFNWRGLVYIEGDLSCSGQSWILGACVVRGATNVAVDFAHGSAVVLYSREALVRTLSEAMNYTVLAWKEQ